MNPPNLSSQPQNNRATKDGHFVRRWSLIFALMLTVAVIAVVTSLTHANGPNLATVESAATSSATKLSSAAPLTVTSQAVPSSAKSTTTPSPAVAAVTQPPAAAATTTPATIPPSAFNNAKLESGAKDAVAGFITQAGEIKADTSTTSPSATPATPNFTAVAFGSALGELEGQAQEFTSNGWIQTGTIAVTGTPSVSNIKGTQQIALTVCIDSSSVQINDATGNIVRPAQKAGTRKNLNIYVLQEIAGTWRVIDHTFPSNPNC